ncbi:Cell division protein FtsX [Clostridium thermopalmarium DSM 5974]|uniref:Cell division protein FtsX n=3 Tax=Clostridiaceae TaxID=31979 RepID=A0A151ALF4_9CLOT|nr:permease-like cell division protein FtsX [Clostridium thermopalmarium]KYH28475.1 cell division protein FtsX [Clostridium colicanis DSM 13634]PRR69080.1 Cell division protein FtsX [Clostridium thermopalmarium DSM 5974]PVZ26569.1 cell division transport system permease protein [Clostridium thermopalmarium DSM 5974]
MVMKISTIKYFFIDALNSLKRNTTLTIASIITVSLTLFMFGVFLLTMLNANQILKHVESKLEVSVFLKDDIKNEDKINIEKALKKVNGLSDITYINKDQALQRWKEQLGEENKDLVRGLEDKNPLPESYIVRVENADTIKSVIESTEKLNGIEKVVANEDLVNQISKLTKGVKWVGFAALMVMIPISLLLIGNTIKLAVYARKKEINIMKFVGATDWFIRWPFIIEGVIIGIIGSIVSSGFLYYSYRVVYQKLSSIIIMLNLITPKYFLMNVIWVFVFSGILIGGLGSILSIRKFLKV